MEGLTRWERTWLISELECLAVRRQGSADTFMRQGDKLIAQSMAKDAETARSIVAKLKGGAV